MLIFIEYRTLGSQARKYSFMQSGLKYCEDHRFWFIAAFGKRKRAKDFMRDCRICCSWGKNYWSKNQILESSKNKEANHALMTSRLLCFSFSKGCQLRPGRVRVRLLGSWYHYVRVIVRLVTVSRRQWYRDICKYLKCTVRFWLWGKNEIIVL